MRCALVYPSSPVRHVQQRNNIEKKEKLWKEIGGVKDMKRKKSKREKKKN